MATQGSESALMFLIGYLHEMRTSERQIQTILQDLTGQSLDISQIRDQRRAFEDMFPALLRVQLARLALTLSEEFYDTVLDYYIPERKTFVRSGTVKISNHYKHYTALLRRNDRNQKIILSDEMVTALMLRAQLHRPHYCTTEGLLMLYLRQHPGPFHPVRFQGFLNGLLGTNQRLEQYRALLQYCCGEDSRLRYQIDRSILPQIVQYLRWLHVANPIDQLQTRMAQTA